MMIRAVLLAALSAATSAKPQAPSSLRASGSNFHVSGLGFAVNEPLVLQWTPHHDGQGATQQQYQLVVREQGTGATVWDSGKVDGAAPRAPYAGRSLSPLKSYEWTVAYWDSAGEQSPESDPAQFHIAPAAADWDGVAWLGDDNKTVYRAEFDVPAGATEVVAYVCGLGYSVVTLDGAAASDQTLATAPWTNNERLNGFSSFSFKNLAGKHVLGVELGTGWRSGFTSKDKDQGGDLTQKVLRAQLVATLKDGTTKILSKTGDPTWTVAAGPVLMSSVYNGETYDARIAHQLAGWNTAAGNTKAFAAPTVLAAANAPMGGMVPWTVQPVQVDLIVKAVKVTNPKKEIYVVDFGVNQAGVSRLLNLDCPIGSVIVLRHAEIMQHAGLPGITPDTTMVYTANLRGAKATDTYTCSGIKGESWSPQFTYHGFRFVEVNVSAAPGVVITAASLEMIHFHSAVPLKTTVKFSSATLNQIQRMALGAQRSNFMTVPTDCDQRDERLGWMGDANLSGDSMLLNYDAVAFFKFFVRTMATEMGDDGSLPDVVPYVRFGGKPGDVSWTGAFANTLYALWKYDGDTELLEPMLPFLLRQLDNVKSQAAVGMSKMHTPYGDWCSPPAKMGGGQGLKPTRSYTSAFSYVKMVAQTLELAQGPLNNKSLATTLTAELASLKADFNTAFYKKSNNTYDVTVTQTALALALELGVSPDAKATGAQLVAEVEAKKSHFSTGIIGLKFLNDALFAAGRADLALTVLQQTTYPSIGYNFANEFEPASTNLWELQDAPKEGTGMNSRNHHMFSSYSSYLVRKVAGLDQEASSSGYTKLLLRTAPVEGLASASSTMRLHAGEVAFNWTRTGGLQTDRVALDHTAQLDCGAEGGIIQNVTFASFGTPQAGSAHPSAMSAHADCHAPMSAAVIADLCVGGQKCSVPALRSLFAPHSENVWCSGRSIANPLALWVQVKCEKPSSLVAEARVPVVSTAKIQFPVGRLLKGENTRNMNNAPLKLSFGTSEEEKVIYHYAAGNLKAAAAVEDAAATGVKGAAVEQDEETGEEVISVAVGSGRYRLRLSFA